MKWDSKKLKQLTDPRNLGLYIFVLIVLAISWSGVKTIQNNYELQKKISLLQQQNNVLRLQNDNAKLQNQYYASDQYLDLAAREDLGLAAPGEQVLLVPKSVAAKYINPAIFAGNGQNQKADTRSRVVKNVEAWRDFLLGRNIAGD